MACALITFRKILFSPKALILLHFLLNLIFTLRFLICLE